jgi:hypothetical protein
VKLGEKAHPTFSPNREDQIDLLSVHVEPHRVAEAMRELFARNALACTLLLALAASFAQNGTPGLIRWMEGAPNATSEVKDETKIEGLKTDHVHIFVSLADLRETEYNRLWVQVSNHGKSPLDFNPQTAVLLKGDKSVRAEVPDKAANAIQRFGEAKSQELSSAHCVAMAAGECSPTNAQMQMSKDVAAFSAGQAQWVRENALKPGTLAPGEEEQGTVGPRECSQTKDTGPR